MDDLTQDFINNVNKSTEKPLDYIVRTEDELKVTREDVYIIIAVACVVGFITWLNLGV